MRESAVPDVSSHPWRTRATRTAAALAGTWFLAWAIFYLTTALFAIKNFAWRQPMFDQWRMYPKLLTNPFPEDVVQLENGHRPIVPNLVRLAEVLWFAADQMVQLTVGIGCAIMSLAVLIAVVWRDRTLSFSARSAGVLISVLGIFWLANSRMLMHGNEALHAHLLLLAVICGALFTYRCRVNGSAGWLGGAAVCCTVATFCFGPGIASFPAVIALGFLLRIPPRRLAIPAFVMIVCLLIYLYVLPGDDGVRNILVLRPWASMKTAVTWLSSPWATAWLGLAEPPLYPEAAESFLRETVGAPLETSANAIARATHVPWRTLSMFIGLVGSLLFVVRVAWMFIRREQPSLLQALAITLGFFALTTAAIIGMGRTEAFMSNPDQVFADRYLMWPCLFWCGLALLQLVDVKNAKSRWPASAGVALLTVVPVGLLPMHAHDAGWSAAVYRDAQQLAAAARSGVVDLDTVNGNADDLPQFEHTESLFRERDLAMFANPAWHLLGTQWAGSLGADDDVAASANWVAHFANGDPTHRAGHFEGVVAKGISHLRGNGQLALLDEHDRIAGFAEFSNLGRGTRALLMGSPRKRGFDGYVVFAQTPQQYRLAWLDIDNQRGILLTRLPTVE